MKHKVVIIGKLPPPFMGPAIATQVLLNSDLKNRFELLHFNNTVNKTIKTQGKFEVAKIFRSFGFYWSFFQLLRAEKPDLVLIPISQTTVGFVKDAPYILISKWLSKKTLIQLRGSNLKTWLNSATGLTRWFFQNVISGTNGVVVLGKKLRYLFEGYFSENEIYVAPNGGDYTFPVPSKKDDKLSVLYFANIYESKGARVLLNAVLVAHEMNAKFVFTGGWRDDIEFKNEFLKDVEESSVEITVNEPTSGDKKFQMFADADVFVFPPIMPEGHPWVLVEAMSAGLPIIATDQGAITESVIDGDNGFIVPAGDSNAILEKLNFLEQNKEERIRMGKRSRELFEQGFSGEKLADNYTAIFNSAIKSL